MESIPGSNLLISSGYYCRSHEKHLYKEAAVKLDRINPLLVLNTHSNQKQPYIFCEILQVKAYLRK